MESLHESLWIATSPETTYRALDKPLTVDVAIIGGGIAGLNAAYFLINEGKSVAVLESQRIATGTTGFTTAKITSLHETKLSYLYFKHGKEVAKKYAESHEWAVRELERIVVTRAISCDFKKVRAYLYTNKTNEKKTILEEYAVAKDIGLSVDYEKNVTDFPFGAAGAIKLENQAIFHPRKYVLGIADIITNTGGFIAENTKVSDVHGENPVVVSTAVGDVHATDVIIATNYPIVDKAFFYMRMNQTRSYAIAVRTKQRIRPDNIYMGVAPDEPTVRTHSEGEKEWVILGGEVHTSGEGDTRKYYENLENITRNLMTVDSVDYRWSAQDSTPIDMLPFIGKMPQTDHVYVTTGFGEWGMTTSVVSAKILTDLIRNRKNPWTEIYSPARVNLFMDRLVEMGKHTLSGFSGYITGSDQELKALKPNEGTVITGNGKKLAVYKDKDGKLHARSAACTHMGCIVAWNTAEKSWDCPCHGSRFTKEGKVIRAPAIDDLPEEKL